MIEGARNLIRKGNNTEQNSALPGRARHPPTLILGTTRERPAKAGLSPRLVPERETSQL